LVSRLAGGAAEGNGDQRANEDDEQDGPEASD
jgi:hypothetical protein